LVEQLQRSLPKAEPIHRAIVAINGSRFKAVNSRDRLFSRGSIERRIEQH
jgi:hypothetical protein